MFMRRAELSLNKELKIIPSLSKKDLLKLLLKVLFWYGELKVNKVSRGKCSAAATTHW